jgi:hypothetical protein
MSLNITTISIKDFNTIILRMLTVSIMAVSITG